MQVITKKSKVLLVFLILIFLLQGCGKKKESGLEEISLQGISSQETSSQETSSQEESNQEKDNRKTDPATEQKPITYVAVYICGAINKEGVYEVPENSRIEEVVALAGFYREDAAKNYLNLAEKVVDGQRLYVPTIQEIEAGEIEEIKEDGQSNRGINKVNINTASMEELMTLTGIGEAKALSIIQYREEQGPFQKIQDIQNISGIKAGVYTKIEEQIRVN